MRMVRWMCGIKVKDRVPSKDFRLRWYEHVMQKEDNDWVKKCMEYEVEGARPRGRGLGERLSKKNCQAHKLNREDAVDHNRWRKQIKDD